MSSAGQDYLACRILSGLRAGGRNKSEGGRGESQRTRDNTAFQRRTRGRGSDLTNVVASHWSGFGRSFSVQCT